MEENENTVKESVFTDVESTETGLPDIKIEASALTKELEKINEPEKVIEEKSKKKKIHSVKDIEVIDKEENKKIYSLMSGDSDEEYFSKLIPVIKDDGICLMEPFLKGVIKESIMEKKVEEYYCDIQSISESILHFKFLTGILIKEFHLNEITWLNSTIKDAEERMKDTVIKTYQTVVPNLINRLNSLEKKQNPGTGSLIQL